MAFNRNDPAYQRELQRASAKRSMGPSRLASAVEEDITSRHAQRQEGRKQQFRGLELTRQGLLQQHERALASAGRFDQSFGLAQQRQGFAESEHAVNKGRAESGLSQTMLMGLLGTGYSVLEGRRREGILKANLARENYRTGIMEDYLNKYKEPRRFPFGLSSGGPGEGA